MWIIPRNLRTSHSVQGTEGSTSDSIERLAELFAQSLMWRSKPSRSATWSRRLKTDTSTQRLSTRTLSDSRGQAFEDEWISSVEASLVNHLVQPDEEPETTTPDTSSPTSSTVSESWGDLPLFSWRTSKGSSHQSSRATDGQTPRGRPFCCMSSESWSAWVTAQRREYSQRVKSAPPINESACLSWVVAPISANQDALLFQGCLSEGEAQMWNTPQSRDYKGVDRRKEARGFSPSLPNQVQPTPHQEAQMWPTPKALEVNETVEQWRIRREREGARRFGQTLTVAVKDQCSKATPPPEVQSSTHGNRPASPAKLNPRWVETLMGLPMGWTMPSCVTPWTIEPMSSAYLETESFQTQPREPSASCGEILTSEDDA